MKLFVDAKSSKQGDGSRENPFKCINDAAKVAAPGDEILVMPGIYRENVCPVRAGLFSRTAGPPAPLYRCHLRQRRRHGLSVRAHRPGGQGAGLRHPARGHCIHPEASGAAGRARLPV